MRNSIIWFFVLVQLVLLSAAASADTNVVTEPFVGVRVIHSKSMKPRQVDIWVAEIDLKAPGVSVLMSRRHLSDARRRLRDLLSPSND